MDATTTATDTVQQGDSHEHGLSDAMAIKIALILAAMTALEVSTYYVDFGAFFLPVLIILMIVKFFTVVSYFMHLKFEHQMFKLLFYTGLGLALFVYFVALATFKFFN